MKAIVLMIVISLIGVFADDLDLCRDDIPAKENFSPAFYTGIWYELFYSDPTFEGDCITHHYTRRGLQQVFDVESTFVINNEYLRIQMEVNIMHPDETPLRAIFNGTGSVDGINFREHIYQVYASDYTNYSIVWWCRVENDQSVERVAIFSRSTTISDAVLSKVDALVLQIGFNREEFKAISHEEAACFVSVPEE